MTETKRRFLIAGGWIAFCLGWAGVFLPGLPTTIFWILAALAFLRTNRRMYARIISHKRFGPGVQLFVEEGKIRKVGKLVSIVAMMGFACLGALAIPPLWVKVLVVAAASAGSVWVATLPTPEAGGTRAPGRLPAAVPGAGEGAAPGAEP